MITYYNYINIISQFLKKPSNELEKTIKIIKNYDNEYLKYLLYDNIYLILRINNNNIYLILRINNNNKIYLNIGDESALESEHDLFYSYKIKRKYLIKTTYNLTKSINKDKNSIEYYYKDKTRNNYKIINYKNNILETCAIYVSKYNYYYYKIYKNNRIFKIMTHCNNDYKTIYLYFYYINYKIYISNNIIKLIFNQCIYNIKKISSIKYYFIFNIFIFDYYLLYIIYYLLHIFIIYYIL